MRTKSVSVVTRNFVSSVSSPLKECDEGDDTTTAGEGTLLTAGGGVVLPRVDRSIDLTCHGPLPIFVLSMLHPRRPSIPPLCDLPVLLALFDVPSVGLVDIIIYLYFFCLIKSVPN